MLTIIRYEGATDIDNASFDNGYTYSAYRGLERAKQEIGGFELAYQQIIFANAIETIEKWVDPRLCGTICYTDVIMLGFDFTNILPDFAPLYPHVRFTLVDAVLSNIPPNVQCIIFREQEGGFIAGVLAGVVSEAKHVGVIAGVPFSVLKSFLNGFFLGVLTVCKECKIEADYVWSFDWRYLGVSTAESYIQQGIDVLFGAAGAMGSESIKHAAKQGSWVIGVDSNEWETTFMSGKVNGSDRVIGSSLKNVDVATYMVMSSVMLNVFYGGDIWIFDYSNRGLGLAPCHQACSIRSPYDQRLSEIERSLADGSRKVPISSANGHVDIYLATQMLGLTGVINQPNVWNMGDLTRGKSTPLQRSGAASALLTSSDSYLSLNHIYLFGGWSPERGELNDLWYYDLGGHVWLQRRFNVAMTNAGQEPNLNTLDEWGMRSNELGWSDGYPSPRSSHSMVALQPGILLIFGGQQLDANYRSITKFGDLWLYRAESLRFGAVSRWTLLPTGATWNRVQNTWKRIASPVARSGHTAHTIRGIKASILHRASALDANTLVGVNGEELADLLEFGLEGSLGNKLTNVVVLFGGRSSHHYENDIWLYWQWPQEQGMVNLTHPQHRWSRLIIQGDQPAARENHASAIYGMKLYVYGGKNSLSFVMRDLWLLDLSPLFDETNKDQTVIANTLHWQKLQDCPIERVEAKMEMMSVIVGDQLLGQAPNMEHVLFLFGGKNGKGQQTDESWLYYLYSGTWQHYITWNGKSPPLLSGHIMVSHNDHIYLSMGETNATSVANAMWWLNLKLEERKEIVCSPGYELITSGANQVCLPCKEGTFNPVAGGTCQSCPTGSLCYGSHIAALAGYWQGESGNFYHCRLSSMCCPLGNCTKSSLNRCGDFRDPTSVLCGKCIDGYSDWTGQCVECSRMDWALIIFIFLLGLVVVIILVYKHPDNSAFFKILVDYSQLSVLILAPMSQITQSLR